VEGKGFVANVTNYRALMAHVLVQIAADRDTGRNPGATGFETLGRASDISGINCVPRRRLVHIRYPPLFLPRDCRMWIFKDDQFLRDPVI